MDLYGWIQLALFLGLLLLVTRPMGVYLFRVLDPQGKTFLDPVLKPVERLCYRLMGIDPKAEQDWKRYAVSMLVFSLVGLLLTYAILRLQGLLPLNPQRLGPVSEHLAFNTAVSFTTNTNWQSYGGESTMSYLSQMVALAFHNFVSAATGIAVAAALVRGIARHTAKTVGNFLVDLVRVTLYLLLPVCLVYAVFLVSQGMIQNFKPYESARLIEPMTVDAPKMDAQGQPVKDEKGNPVTEKQVVESQTIVQGPMASQVAIKMLGTNGGGYVNANAAHPYENPTPLSNFVQIFSIFLIPSGLTYYLGRMVKNQKHGWAVWSAMAVLFLAGVLALLVCGSRGKPPSSRPRRGVRGGKHGGEGGPVRDLQFRAVRHRDHGRLLRRGEFDARLLHAAGGSRPAGQHAAGRGGLRRRRARGCTGCWSSWCSPCSWRG